jgi:arylsulfatase A-like enzyme
VTFTDRYVGKLVDFIRAQPWAARTVIIVTSDHGEAFGENGLWKHAFELWEPLIHVPLFFLAPGARPHRIAARRSAVDLAPTILDLLGVASDPGMKGSSLVREIYGAPAQDREIFADLPATSDSGRRRALLSGSEKLLCLDDDAHCKLFDLATDPGEHDAVTRGESFRALKERYDELSRSISEVQPYACTADCLNAAYRKKEAAP